MTYLQIAISQYITKVTANLFLLPKGFIGDSLEMCISPNGP